MLYEISREVAAELAKRQVPAPVSYGPERGPSSLTTRIVFDDDPGGDSFEVSSISGNPRRPMVCWQGLKVSVYAKDEKNGARIYEHRRLARMIVDRLLICLRNVVVGRKNNLRIASAAFVPIADQQGAEVFSSALYELRVAIDRGMEDRKWDGSARPEVTIVAPEDEGVHVVTTNVARMGDSEEIASLPPGP